MQSPLKNKNEKLCSIPVVDLLQHCVIMASPGNSFLLGSKFL